MVGATFGHVRPVAAVCVADLLPLVDRAHALRRTLHRCRHDHDRAARRSGRATSSGAMSWICGCDVSTRLMKLACMPGEHRRHEDDDADADGDAADDEHRLHPPSLQEADRGDPFEGQPAVHGSDAPHALAGRRRRIAAVMANDSPSTQPVEDFDLAVADAGRA